MSVQTASGTGCRNRSASENRIGHGAVACSFYVTVRQGERGGAVQNGFMSGSEDSSTVTVQTVKTSALRCHLRLSYPMADGYARVPGPLGKRDLQFRPLLARWRHGWSPWRPWGTRGRHRAAPSRYSCASTRGMLHAVPHAIDHHAHGHDPHEVSGGAGATESSGPDAYPASLWKRSRTVGAIKPDQCCGCHAPFSGDDPTPLRHPGIARPPSNPLGTE